jgi:putative transcriptional regulator
MRDHDFEKLIESVKQAGEIKRGKRKPGRVIQFDPANIKSIRKKLDKSQSEFALMIGVSISTLQNWEQGRRQPEGPARALLKIASENPEAVAQALSI